MTEPDEPMQDTNPLRDHDLLMTRRQLFGRSALGLGTAAMAGLMGDSLAGASGSEGDGLHHPAKVKRDLAQLETGFPNEYSKLYRRFGAARAQRILALAKKKGGNLQAVATYPVGVGTAERPTPKGRMYITRKKLRPTWYVPASIAADHRKKGDPLPAVVPPGPLNPLGEHALYLSRSGYLVHGTNKPASIGLRATVTYVLDPFSTL